MAQSIFGLIFFVALLLSGCTSNEIVRTIALKSKSSECDFKGHAADLSYFTKKKNKKDIDCTQYSIEDHEDYTLGIVEFDDQGWLHNRKQMDLLMDELTRQATGESGKEQNDLSIFVYVHGWKHNADFCDDNLCCFRETLKQMNMLEENYAKEYHWNRRKVVGIYVGWRGLSLLGPDFIRSLSFYSRKNAATRVALGSTRELLGKIKDFYERQNADPKPDPNAAATQNAEKKPLTRKDMQQLPMQTDSDLTGNNLKRSGTRLLTVGHSFGGLVVYTAVAQTLMESAIEPTDAQSTQYVKPFGDLVFLVNAAFEATRYEPLHQIAKNRTYAPYQPPVFVSVTSDADTATRVAFPAGRWANYLSLLGYSDGLDEKEKKVVVDHTLAQQREANVFTIGHAERYRTHTLSYDKDLQRDKLSAPDSTDTDNCSCRYRRGIENFLGKANIRAERSEWEKDKVKNLKEGKRVAGWTRQYAGDGTTLVNNKDVSVPDNPFWVICTDKDFIPDHNGFYTPLFLNFVRHTFDDSLHLWREVKELAKAKAVDQTPKTK